MSKYGKGGNSGGYYGGGGGYQPPSAPFTPTYGSSGGGGGGGGSDAPEDNDVGKGSINLSDPVGSIGKTIGSFAGLVGSIGIPGGPNLGGVAALPGQALDAAGGITLPYLGNDPNKRAATLGEVPGLIGDVLGAPERFVESETAKDRLRAAQEGRQSDLAGFVGGVGVAPDIQSRLQARYDEQHGLTTEEGPGIELPPEYQARLDAGESIDSIANDMVENGEGFTSDKTRNLGLSFALDPMNLIAPGASKLGKAAKGAGAAVTALEDGERIGVGTRFAGTAYNAASRGLSAGGAKLMDNLIGPTTSGVFHALGSRPYAKITSAVGRLAPEYATAYQDAFARGAAQLPRAVLAKDMGDEVAAGVRTFGKGENPTQTVEAALQAVRRVPKNRIERDVEELLMRTAPDFAGHSDEARFLETRDKLAQITGMSPEDAARALGGKVDLKTAQHVHLAFYGKAGDDLAKAKAATAVAKDFDPELVTIIAPDTLTEEIAEDILTGKADITSAVENYSVLRNRFGGTQYAHDKVLDFVKKLKSENALSKTTISPTTGRHKLPPAIKAWAREYEASGYKVGFAPKDGFKAIIDPDTETVIHADPFVHFVSEADPLTVRNPIGRFVDSLMRGSSQTTIILDSRNRMVNLMKKSGLSSNQTRAIHRDILQTAAERSVSPRGLAGTHGGPNGNAFDEIFARHMEPSEFAAFRQAHDPTFIVMKSFEGDLMRVGITQKFTGAVKSSVADVFRGTGGGTVIPKITEYIYPNVRFSLSPLFQLQEKVESPFLNALRGVRPHTVDEDVASVFTKMSELPDFKFLSEAGYTLNINGAQAAGQMVGRQGPLGRALGRFVRPFGNVAAGKERARIAQVFHEHGENFQEAVNAVNPRLWQTMSEAYGTTDPRAIAEAFIKERQALASGKLDEAMSVFDRARQAAIQRAYDAGDIAKGQRLNGEAAALRGGTAESGGAIKGAVERGFDPDTETVWQAFRESFRQTSQQAFKTHYFSPERGFLERSINHPYLGLYPASYMWGKVLPEFARFLLKRPFGLDAPLVGVNAMTRVQEAMAGAMATDPDFAQFMDDNKDAIYLIDQLLPGDPTNLVANAPAWTRHLAEDNQDRAANPYYKSGPRKGQRKQFDPQEFISREAGDAAQYAFGPYRSLDVAARGLGDVGDLAGDIFANLTKSAEQYDQFVPSR